jgi:hypothetical protein
MSGLLLFFAAQAMTIHDICPEPFTDTKSPGTYCSIQTRQRIETEYYSFTIEPPVLILFYNEGRTMEVMPAIRQSPVLIGFSVDDKSQQELVRSLAFYNCPDATLKQGELLRCERRDEDYVSRIYAGLRGEHVISVGYSRSPLVESAPDDEARFERMLESIQLTPP